MSLALTEEVAAMLIQVTNEVNSLQANTREVRSLRSLGERLPSRRMIEWRARRSDSCKNL